MKIKNIIACTIIIISFFGCKDKASETTTETETIALKITVDLVAKESDNFCLLYTEDGSINFGNKGIWKRVVGNEQPQNVEFLFKEDAFPNQLRLDLGMNSVQEQVTINSITFEYAGKKRVVKGTELGAFFCADTSKCTFDMNTGIATSKVVDGKRTNISLYPIQNVQAAELPKMFNK